MRATAYRIGNVWKRTPGHESIVRSTFHNVTIHVGSYCSGQNALPAMFKIFSAMLLDMFGVVHVVVMVWSVDNDEDMQTIMQIQGLDPIYEDAIQLASGKAVNINTGRTESISTPDVIFAGIVCAGVSPSSIYYGSKNSVLADRSHGTGETWDYLYRYLRIPSVNSRVKLVLVEVGTGFECSDADVVSCMTLAGGQMGGLGYTTDKISCDCKKYGSRQRRKRLHIKFTKQSSQSNSGLYQDMMHRFERNDVPEFSAFLESTRSAEADIFLNRPWNKRVAKVQRTGGSGDADCRDVCVAAGVPFPPKYHEQPTPEFFGLPSDVNMMFMGSPEPLQAREYNVAYTKLRAEKMHERYPPQSCIVLPWDRSLKRWSKDVIDECPTIEPGSKFYVLRRHPIGQKCLRPLIVRELYRLQGAEMHEIYDSRQIAEIVKRFQFRTMIKVLGHGYHWGVELSHFASSMASSMPMCSDTSQDLVR